MSNIYSDDPQAPILPTVQLLTIIIADFCKTNNVIGIENWDTRQVEAYLITSLNYYQLNYYSSYVTATQKAYVEQMGTIYDSFSDPFADIAALAKAYSDLSQKIMVDNGLTEEQKSPLLIATSIALYSTYYWKQASEATMDTNLWYNYVNTVSPSGLFNWHAVAKADLLGFVTGFIGGIFGVGPGAGAGVVMSAVVAILQLF